MNYDLLLRWLSEIGSGSWDRFRAASASLQLGEGRDAKPAWMVANSLEDLGHLDVDYQRRRWSVAPPVLSLLPGTGLCAVLTGSRTRFFHDRVESLEASGIYPFQVAQPDGPSAQFVKGGSVEDLQAFAEAIDTPFLIEPAARISAIIPTIEGQLESAISPHPEAELEWFDPLELAWSRISAPAEPGLHRWRHAGRRHHRLYRGGSWVDSEDLGFVYFAALNLVERSPILRWQGRTDSREKPDLLIVDGPLPLPRLAERAAVASSGLLPQRGPVARTYKNVTQTTAQRIAESLGQTLDSSA